jgi:hypothetical protein
MSIKKRLLKERVKKIKSWIYFPTKKGENMPYCSYEEYEEGFRGIRFSWAFR